VYLLWYHVVYITYYPELCINLHDQYVTVDHLSSSVDLSGVEVIETDRRLIKQARKEVETQAQKMLEQGMEMQV